jgi:DNA invertase Pin-like site-specific DNA recombinase
VKPKKAILYARVSDSPTAATSQSCQAQFEMLEQFAADHDFVVIDRFSDHAISGGQELREGLREAERQLKRGQTLIILAYDRLFRSTEKGLVFIARLKASGRDVISINEPVDLSNPFGRMMMKLALMFAEMERELKNQRTSDTMRAYQRQGRKQSHQPAYGYRWDPDFHPGPDDPARGRSIPDPDEQPVLQQILKMHEKDDYSPYRIARHLNAAGVPARCGGQWHPQVIQRILQRHAGNYAPAV